MISPNGACWAILAALLALPALQGQTDWEMFGHDPGAMRYSPLKQINSSNVAQLQLAWEFDTEVQDPSEEASASARAGAAGSSAEAPPRRGRRRLSESIPLVVGGVLYMSTPYSRIVALDAENGQKIWEYVSPHPPALRGISYWPGTKGFPPQIVFGTVDGWLICLNAKTGKPVPGFGTEGMIDLKPGVTELYPKARLGVTS